MVAKLLVKHGVQIAVLKACESARATSGDNLVNMLVERVCGKENYQSRSLSFMDMETNFID